jgi:hypothetical protein
MTTYNSPFSGDVVQPTDVSFKSYALTASIDLYWPLNGVPPTFNIAARIMNITANSAGYSITMPPANQASVGQDALFNNTGANAINIVNYDGNAIATVEAGKAEYIYITNNNTEAGTWGVIDFGSTTANSNASALAGYGLLAIANTLNQSHPSSSVADGATISDTARANTVIWTGGAGGADLPVSSAVGDNWFFLFKNNGTGTFTLSCTGLDTIDNGASKDFQPNESSIIVSTGSEYVTVGFGTSNTFFFTALTKNVVNGTYSLTASEASSVIQEYVGTLTGNVIIEYPPVVGFYVVRSSVIASGYSLTLTTGVSGGADVVVPSGQQVSLICDGTNFYNANTVQAGASSFSLQNGSAGSPSLFFASEPTTGIYRSGSGEIGFTVSGTAIGYFDGNGLSFVGTGNFEDGISGGTF